MNAATVLAVVILLVGISALCSGLNVALMSLDVHDLQRKNKLGNKDARKALPLRRKTHLTLSAILLANVAAVSATSLVLESKLYGVIAGLISTLLIVVFGEIVPQAILSRRALYYTARFSLVLKTMIVLTYPLAKPLQLLLDRLFKAVPPHLQTRRELGIMISEHLDTKESELDGDEVEIIRGALQLSEKRVRDIMTAIDNVFWLTPQTVIDGGGIDGIKERGYSRIPIMNGARTICYGLLLVKDLVDVDFDDSPPRVDDLILRPTEAVGSMTALDTLFRKFINSGTHLLPVERDDQIVGIVTIEDLIEEIVGHEIEDETDRSKLR